MPPAVVVVALAAISLWARPLTFSLSQVRDEGAALRPALAGSLARMGVIEKLQRSRPEIVHVFDQLVRTTPDGIYLTLVKQTNRKIELKGIAQSSTRVASAAGKSANIELGPQLEKIGGNGPLMSMAASGMGCQVTCIGLLGYPDLHPVFRPLKSICKVVSVGAPGHTDALEFHDGKLMLGKHQALGDVSWDNILSRVGELLNDVIGLNEHMTGELVRVAKVVGQEGKMHERASVGAARGAWAASIAPEAPRACP